MTDSFGFLVVTFIIILGFEAVNGWTDAPNSIATVISTRVLAPMTAVAMAAFFNLVGALSGTAVATTIGKGLVDQELVGLDTIAAAAAAVIIWSTAAWYFGLPTSESHGIVSGLAGAAVATSGGLDVLQWEGWRKVFTGLGLAVVAGFLGGFLVMVAVLWLFRRAAPALVRRLFAVLQILSSAFMAFSHGTADGQKAMGVMALAIAVYEKTPPEEFAVPLWIILLAAGTMSVSTGLGGWRIIRTLGMKVTHLDTPRVSLRRLPQLPPSPSARTWASPSAPPMPSGRRSWEWGPRGGCRPCAGGWPTTSSAPGCLRSRPVSGWAGSSPG